jgi:hypothetical protein
LGLVTREQLEQAGSVRAAIAIYKKAGILRRFPAEFLDRSIADIDPAAARGDQAARRARKLLFDKRFDK